MVKIIEIIIAALAIIAGVAIFFGAIALEVAHGIMEKTDENRTRKHK